MWKAKWFRPKPEGAPGEIDEEAEWAAPDPDPETPSDRQLRLFHKLIVEEERKKARMEEALRSVQQDIYLNGKRMSRAEYDLYQARQKLNELAMKKMDKEVRKKKETATITRLTFDQKTRLYQRYYPEITRREAVERKIDVQVGGWVHRGRCPVCGDDRDGVYEWPIGGQPYKCCGWPCALILVKHMEDVDAEIRAAMTFGTAVDIEVPEWWHPFWVSGYEPYVPPEVEEEAF